jgi:predicted enzyme related to lactoylglutathione lyase
MSQPGTIGWIDLTVPNATAVRDFYAAVAGWVPADVPMGDYADFSMHRPGEQNPVAGICHARGTNANLPPQWLIYITIANLDQSIARCQELGGNVLVGPKSLGYYGRLAIIQDPAGAVAALMEPAAAASQS